MQGGNTQPGDVPDYVVPPRGDAETEPLNDAEVARPKIITRDLHVYYGDFEAIKGVDINIGANEITALIGPSGCGKSTFLRSLNRMNDEIDGSRTTGEVMIDGEDILQTGTDVAALRRKVGMVFQQPNPFPMSIYDNIVYGPRLHGRLTRAEADTIVERSLRNAGLWDEVKDKLRGSALALSGGQQQRLCIARCLAVEPEIVLMDEPCSALDPTATFRIEELMLQLKEIYTIVIVTHNMYQASRVSDYTGFFLMGELIEYDVTERIFEDPRDERTDAYVRGRFG
ncbi:MAG: phosphate ABC transporter ATP-binding protein [Armatimonadetes bacterium]|nr:phosphate ABC transporter ATP-binding protein [Armatimonadota bacterium]